MMGAFLSLAASSDATTVEEEVTFWNRVSSFPVLIVNYERTMAGMANSLSCAYLNSFSTSSPTMTPVFRLKSAVAMLPRCVRIVESD